MVKRVGVGVGAGKLRLVSSDPPPPESKVGQKLRDLREALGLTQDRVAQRTEEEEARSGGRYRALGRVYYNNLENGRNAGETERVRGVLSAVFGITRDQLADYLDGVLPLPALLEVIRSKAPTIPLLRDHPRWAGLCAEALRFDPQLRPETLDAIGAAPWPWGPVESVTTAQVVGLANVVQRVPPRHGST